MRNLISILLVIMLTLFVGCAPAKRVTLEDLDEITGPQTAEEACQALVSRVSEAKLFPSIPKECFFCDVEGKDGRSVQIALRYDQGKCGGDAASTLLDRFLVFERSPVILWYHSGLDRYLPWEYAFSYSR